jgi:hypothetical protein
MLKSLTFRSGVFDRYQVVARKKVVASINSFLSKLEAEVQKPSFLKSWIDDSADYPQFLERIGVDLKGKKLDKEIKEKARERLDEDWSDFEDRFYELAKEENGNLVGYRCIGVEDVEEFVEALKKGEYLEGYEGVGIFFSWNQDAAECHWGEGSETVTVKALIPYTSIDIKRTARANMSLSSFEEEEITLKAGAKILVDEILSEDNKKLLYGIPPFPAVASKQCPDRR